MKSIPEIITSVLSTAKHSVFIKSTDTFIEAFMKKTW